VRLFTGKLTSQSRKNTAGSFPKNESCTEVKISHRQLYHKCDDKQKIKGSRAAVLPEMMIVIITVLLSYPPL